MADAGGLELAAVLTGGFFVVLLVLLAVVLVRRWWRGREAAASGRGFVLFGVCFPEDRSQQRSRTYRRRASRGVEASAGDDEEPGESELARWKKLFGGPARCLSTIEEGTEKGTPAATTPAFCSPPPSPDRRDGRTTLQAV